MCAASSSLAGSAIRGHQFDAGRRRATRKAARAADTPHSGPTDPARMLAADRLAWGAIVVFGTAVNLLMLTGPLFMLQVYDQILPAGSVAMLASAFALVCALYAGMGALDVARLHLCTVLAQRMQARWDAALAKVATGGAAMGGAPAPSDIDAMRRAMAAPGMIAMLDMAWAPLFLGALFVLHPWFGWVGLGACLVLGGASVWQHRATRDPEAQALAEAAAAESLWAVARGQGSAHFPVSGWLQRRRAAGRAAGQIGARLALLTGVTRALRLFLPSALLALGALLALDAQASPGAMIAAAILSLRALAPVEQGIAHWPYWAEGRAARKRLLAARDMRDHGTGGSAAPAGPAVLRVSGLSVLCAGLTRPGLQGVSLTAAPGTILGVIGPQGAGKSLLLRAIAGGAAPASGNVLWGGLPLRGWRTGCVGILPQRVDLIAGSLAENIALGRAAGPGLLARAARLAGLEPLLDSLPDGFDTQLGPGARHLSEGETRQVGLARAILGRPRLLLLDDPDAGLDGAGCAAFSALLRDLGSDDTIILLAGQRPSSVAACDRLLLLDQGRVMAEGPRDAVLRQLAEPLAFVAPRSSASRSSPGDAP